MGWGFDMGGLCVAPYFNRALNWDVIMSIKRPSWSFRIDSGLFLNRLNLISNSNKKKSTLWLRPIYLVGRLNLSKYSTAKKNSNNWHRMWLYQHVINRKKIFRKFSLRKNRWLDLSKAKLKALKEALDDVIDVVEALERNELIKNSN